MIVCQFQINHFRIEEKQFWRYQIRRRRCVIGILVLVLEKNLDLNIDYAIIGNIKIDLFFAGRGSIYFLLFNLQVKYLRSQGVFFVVPARLVPD
jgi:hypothetical protein